MKRIIGKSAARQSARATVGHMALWRLGAFPFRNILIAWTLCDQVMGVLDPASAFLLAKLVIRSRIEECQGLDNLRRVSCTIRMDTS